LKNFIGRIKFSSFFLSAGSVGPATNPLGLTATAKSHSGAIVKAPAL
jgi:hypothetical protein